MLESTVEYLGWDVKLNHQFPDISFLNYCHKIDLYENNISV